MRKLTIILMLIFVGVTAYAASSPVGLWPLAVADDCVSLHALLHFDGDGGPYRAEMLFHQEILRGQSLIPCFITSFAGLNEYTSNETYHPCYVQDNFKNYWESFKEIAGQSYGENGFPNISYDFCNKLTASFVDDYFHNADGSIENRWCQGGSDG